MNAFGKQLTDKIIMLEDGTQLGELYNVQVDTATGEIDSLLMDREESKTARDDRAAEVPFAQQRDGLYEVPAENVRAIEDYIIVTPPSRH